MAKRKPGIDAVKFNSDGTAKIINTTAPTDSYCERWTNADSKRAQIILKSKYPTGITEDISYVRALLKTEIGQDWIGIDTAISQYHAQTRPDIVSSKRILPANPTEAMQILAVTINESIHEAKNLGVSPEKLAPLYNSLKQQLEVLAEIQGTLDRSTKIMNLTKVDFNAEIEEYVKAIELSR
jgi:hypothetical protein